MAQKNNILSYILSSSPSFVSQLLLGLLLIIILSIAGATPALSIFIGILGALILGGFTAASENSPEEPVIASFDGIDAGLKYWIFFLVGFILLGYKPHVSIVLGGIAGIGGGWIIAWWKSKEPTKTQLETENPENAETEKPTRMTRPQSRKPTHRYRRTSGFNFQFWKR